MTEFRFAYPFVLILLLAPSLILLVPSVRIYRLQPVSLLYSDIRLVSNAPKSWRVRLRRIPDVMRLGAWCLLIIILARPQTGNAREIIRGQGVDIVLAVDISNSMAALDFEPLNRLESAKTVIGEFIVGRDFDRIGLVVFARDAFHHVPLTLDYDVLIQQLDRVELVRDITDSAGTPLLLDGTAIGLGIASSVNMLRGSGSPSQVVILLTDGDNNSGLDPIEAAEVAQTLGIRIYTIGVGREGEVPYPDDAGNVTLIASFLDEPLLIDVAEIASGQYYRAQDLDDLQVIYDQIDTLERSDIEIQVVVRWRDQVMNLMMLTLVLLLGERILRHTLFEGVP